MLSFACDYLEGAHPEVLRKLIETNLDQQVGYSEDEFCASAREKIKRMTNAPKADVFFLSGGTQTNQTVISAMLKSYEGVISAKSGHINVHEAGAIEYTGHKVLALPSHNGKLDPVEIADHIKTFYSDESHEHMVFPGMVYISHPTEYGTLYTKAELEAISLVCRENNIPLFLDGARLGYGLMSFDTDVTLSDIAQFCDVFYIGGTKVGALCGEAVVFPKGNAPKYFMTMVKQRGAMLAKGRLLGVQFDALFTDDLYFNISRHAIEMAEKLKTMFSSKGYRFFMDSPTNQQFIILENSFMERLSKQVGFSIWERYDQDHTVVRFATGWATTEEQLKMLDELI